MKNKNIMKTVLSLVLLIAILGSISPVSAATIQIVTKDEQARLETEITRAQALSYFANYYTENIPNSYQYIDLKFLDIPKTSDLYKDIQVLVYFDLIKNTPTKLFPAKKIDIYTFGKLSENILWISMDSGAEKSELQLQMTTNQDLENVKKLITARGKTLQTGDQFDDIDGKVQIFTDVYETLMKVHYNRDNLKWEDLIYSAIEWLAEWADDTYTTYFPPVKSQDFQESINGEYEGIGSYVEMTDPGKLIIITPIVDSPSERAGIKWGDRVTHVDGKEITKEVGLPEAVSWIKWPKGTKVSLTILRGEQVLEIEVIREKIVIKDIDFSTPKTDTFYIQVKNFGPHVFDEFTLALDELETNTRIKKVIIDVRNNPGGYLDQVSRILSYFVPDGEPTAIVDYGTEDQSYTSAGYDKIDFSQYEIVLLQNGGSASASEILVGTIKDYFPESTIIGEKSFGKGSVQNIKSYSDGSTLKVTIAKWFTGKTRQGIDGVGISPDIEVIFDTERETSRGIDNQLEAALQQ